MSSLNELEMAFKRFVQQ